MQRFSPLWLVLCFVAGCHAPVPKIDVLAPYGATRIPPPSTGIIAPGQYYEQGGDVPAEPASKTGFRAPSLSAGQSAAANSNSVGTGIRTAGAANEGGTVSQAVHQTPTAAPASASPVSATPDAKSSSSQTAVESSGAGSTSAPSTLPPNIRGMHINEAPAAPSPTKATVESVDITQLPPATTARYASVVPRNEAIGTSATAATGQSSSASQLGWQTRD